MKTYIHKTSLLLSFGLCTCLQMMACGPDEPTPTDQGVDMVQSMPDMPAQDMGCAGASCPSEEMGAVCGDGTLQQGEQCDDGNTTEGDGCNATCEQEVVAVCGDGVVQEGEACDAGEQPDPSCEYGEVACQVCDVNCELVEGMASWCGDGIVQQEQGEVCDEGDQNDDLGACLTDCTRPLPVKVYGAGRNTYAIMSNGTVYAWGDNEFGQIGDGTTQTRTTPTLMNGISGAVEIAGGSQSVCVRLDNGEVWCVGRGVNGELGHGLFESSVSVVKTKSIQDVSRLVGFNQHYCALEQSGKAWCWGRDVAGALGTPDDYTDQSQPNAVNLPSDVDSIVTGIHTCALLTNQQVWCWGEKRDRYGELQDRDKDRSPEHVVDLNGTTELLAIARGLIFRHMDGDYYGVGVNRFQSFGLFTEELVIYDPIKLDKATSGDQVYANGNNHVCATSPTRGLTCWGARTSGQLSDNIPGQAHVEVEGVKGVKHVGLGGGHTCVIDENDDVWCWGANEHGQLGQPVSEDVQEPQRVEFWPEP